MNVNFNLPDPMQSFLTLWEGQGIVCGGEWCNLMNMKFCRKPLQLFIPITAWYFTSGVSSVAYLCAWLTEHAWCQPQV